MQREKETLTNINWYNLYKKYTTLNASCNGPKRRTIPATAINTSANILQNAGYKVITLKALVESLPTEIDIRKYNEAYLNGASET